MKINTYEKRIEHPLNNHLFGSNTNWTINSINYEISLNIINIIKSIKEYINYDDINIDKGTLFRIIDYFTTTLKRNYLSFNSWEDTMLLQCIYNNNSNIIIKLEEYYKSYPTQITYIINKYNLTFNMPVYEYVQAIINKNRIDEINNLYNILETEINDIELYNYIIDIIYDVTNIIPLQNDKLININNIDDSYVQNNKKIKSN